MGSLNKNKIIKWLAMWDIYGLECLINLTEWEQKQVMAVLKEEQLTGYPKIEFLLLRARMNSQRHYEIYVFESSGLDETTIKESFKSSPQFIVDFIRKNGAKVYSDRSNNDPRQVIV